MTSSLLRLLALIILAKAAFAEQLVLPDWDATVRIDNQHQYLVTFSKKYTDTLQTTITQVRNESEWHWQQEFIIKFNDRTESVAWNIVQDGKILRWYARTPKGHHVCHGINSDGYVDNVPKTAHYIVISRQSVNHNDSIEEHVFISIKDNIFTLLKCPSN